MPSARPPMHGLDKQQHARHACRASQHGVALPHQRCWPCPRTVQPSVSTGRRARAARQVAAAAAASDSTPRGDTTFGLFICSGSPEMAEAAAAAGMDWLCLDAQHGAVPYDRLKFMLAASSGGGSSGGGGAKRIVRVGGPSDRFGIQQALDLGADGVMVPLINSRADALQAVSYCLFPPQGQRSVAGDTGAVFKRGVGASVLSQYLRAANKEVEVWLQVETKACLEAIDDVLSVPGITCAFLGPADMGFSFGLHVQHDYDLPAMMASSEMQQIHEAVLQACRRHGVSPGVFCLGEERAGQLAKMGFTRIGYQTELGVVVAYAQASLAKLRGAG